MLGSYAVEFLGMLAPHFPLLAVAFVAALAFARTSARLPVLVPVEASPVGPRRLYHRAAPYVRLKDRSRGGHRLPRAPDC